MEIIILIIETGRQLPQKKLKSFKQLGRIIKMIQVSSVKELPLSFQNPNRENTSVKIVGSKSFADKIRKIFSDSSEYIGFGIKDGTERMFY